MLIFAEDCTKLKASSEIKSTLPSKFKFTVVAHNFMYSFRGVHQLTWFDRGLRFLYLDTVNLRSCTIKPSSLEVNFWYLIRADMIWIWWDSNRTKDLSCWFLVGFIKFHNLIDRRHTHVKGRTVALLALTEFPKLFCLMWPYLLWSDITISRKKIRLTFKFI